MKTVLLAELALKQLDNLGHQLNKHGVTNRINRHNCIATLMIQQQKLKGELARAALHWSLIKSQARRLKQQINIRLFNP